MARISLPLKGGAEMRQPVFCAAALVAIMFANGAFAAA